MIIPEYKLLFIHIPKTGGQSLTEFFLKNTLDNPIGYWEHWKHSMKLAVRMGVLSAKSIVQAFMPNRFADDGPATIYNTYNEIKDLPNVKALFKELSSK